MAAKLFFTMALVALTTFHGTAALSMNIFNRSAVVPARPVAGASVAGTRKAAAFGNKTAWTGPATERRRAYVAQREEREAGRQKKRLSGVFTPEQMEAFELARREVPSGANRYWEAIAARVPGQSAEACKRMAESRLFEKAAGTQQGFFGGYVDVVEVKDYVDENADVMKKFSDFFGKR